MSIKTGSKIRNQMTAAKRTEIYKLVKKFRSYDKRCQKNENKNKKLNIQKKRDLLILIYPNQGDHRLDSRNWKNRIGGVIE